MKPEIQRILRKAGLEKSGEDAAPVGQLLEDAGLGLSETIQNLAEIANSSGNEALRMKANETALKMHGALKEQPSAVFPSFTLVISDPFAQGRVVAEVAGGENPIFLPRQLLSQLEKEKNPN